MRQSQKKLPIQADNAFLFSTNMSNLFPVLSDLLSQGLTVNLTVTGNSMYPFLRNCRDSVFLASPSLYRPKKGRIVLMKKPKGQYVLHRIVKLNKEGFFMLGDAQIISEGPFHTESIVAVVTAIRRKNRIIRTRYIAWRMMSYLWFLLRPFRKQLIDGISRLSVYKSNINSCLFH